MRIFILRNEESFIDKTMFVPLTKNGINKSKNLLKIINKLNINNIITSPFIRTLQTIYPYSKYKNIKIKLDYSLVEEYNGNYIPRITSNEFPDYLANQFNTDNKYISITLPKEIKYNEGLENVKKRIKKLLKYLMETFGNSNENIILVTHKIIINNIIKIGAKSKHTVIPHDYPDNYDYPNGGITEILNEQGWVFNKINW